MKSTSKVAIITGAGTGVGAACATQLVEAGCNVVVNFSKSAQDATTVMDACNKIRQGSAITAQGNVAEDADCKRIARNTLDKWGRIDILINNAGITKFVDAADLDGLVTEDWHSLYAVNVVGAYQMVRACAAAMRAEGEGSVVNISSLSGVMGFGSSTAYVATKGAMNAMTLALARALSPEIRVNAVAPGMIETRWHTSRFPDAESYAKFKKAYTDIVPLDKAATADDVADVAVWLATRAALVTGEIVMVDGGLHLGRFSRKRAETPQQK